MKLCSTRNQELTSSWRDAVLSGIAPDGGLYIPTSLPRVSAAERGRLVSATFPAICEELAALCLGGEVPRPFLHQLCLEAFNFPVPLRQLNDSTYILELFHGPTCAFKDFGARFMAMLFRFFWGSNQQPLTVLVATSGDTGSAVANAFLDTSAHPSIRVVILYPRDKVSPIQRKQMTTLGHNVTACEVEGTFDDCQAIVKRALTDSSLTKTQALTSANSINIARLIPQMFYYAFTTLRFPDDSPPTFVVPSGNLGNITAALMAHICGFTAQHLIAACNSNSTFPDFLQSGIFSARPSQETISNAMDVGAPSNFFRINSLLGSPLESTLVSPHAAPASLFSGYSISDIETYQAIREYHSRYGYCLDPHTAVGAVALTRHRDLQASDIPSVIAATAHPAKFSAIVERALGISPALPNQLAHLLDKPEHRITLSTRYEDFTSLIRSSTFLQ